jgi:hypothetical protein
MTQMTVAEMSAERTENNRNPVDRLIATLNRMRAFLAAPPTDVGHFREQIEIFVAELDEAQHAIGIRQGSLWDALCVRWDEKENEGKDVEELVEDWAGVVDDIQEKVDDMEETIHEAAEAIAKLGLREAVYGGMLDKSLRYLLPMFED